MLDGEEKDGSLLADQVSMVAKLVSDRPGSASIAEHGGRQPGLGGDDRGRSTRPKRALGAHADAGNIAASLPVSHSPDARLAQHEDSRDPRRIVSQRATRPPTNGLHC